MIAHTGENAELGESSSITVGMQTCTTTLKTSMEVSQKIGNQPTSGPSNATLRHIPKGCSDQTTRTFV